MFAFDVYFKEAVNVKAHKTATHAQQFLKKYFSFQILHRDNGLQQLFLFYWKGNSFSSTLQVQCSSLQLSIKHG